VEVARGQGRKPVVIVGAGVAGLTAATALARAGARVAVVEAASRPGGRLGTAGEVRVDHGGASFVFPLARGLPVLGPRHQNVRRLLEAYGLAADLVPLDRREVILPPVLGRPRRVPLPGTWPGPLATLEALLALAPLAPGLGRPAAAGTILSHLLAFSGQDDVPLYDRLSAADLLAGLPRPLRSIARSVGQVRLFVEPDEASLAAYLAGLTAGGALARRATFAADPERALFAPLTRALRNTGNPVWTGTRAEELVVAGGRIVAVVVRGPEGRRRVPAAAAILAVDPPALKELASRGGLGEALGRMRLPRGVPSTVARLWFSRDIGPGRPPSGILVGPTAGRFFWLHRIQAAAREFHRATGGSVLEFHLHGQAARNAALAGDEEVLSGLCELAEAAWPEVEGGRIHGHVQRNPPTLPGFGPGVMSGLPAVATRADNLALAGDFVKAPWLALHLERACVTGLLAAKHVAAAAGVDPAAIPEVVTPAAPARAAVRGRAWLRGLRQRGLLPSIRGGGLPDAPLESPKVNEAA
jgi:isorenieratene synthase